MLLPLLVILLWVVVNVAGERSTPDESGEYEEVPAKATVGRDVFLVPVGRTPLLELEESSRTSTIASALRQNVLCAVELRQQVSTLPVDSSSAGSSCFA